MRSIRLSCSALTALLLLATPAPAQVTGSYTAPAEFMNLFFDFTGSEEPDYPAGQPTLGQMVTQSARESAGGAPGPLVLVVGSEGRGLSRVVAGACDLLVRIPMASGNESLNAGIAASIALYEIAGIRGRQR